MTFGLQDQIKDCADFVWEFMVFSWYLWFIWNCLDLSCGNISGKFLVFKLLMQSIKSFPFIYHKTLIQPFSFARPHQGSVMPPKLKIKAIHISNNGNNDPYKLLNSWCCTYNSWQNQLHTPRSNSVCRDNNGAPVSFSARHCIQTGTAEPPQKSAKETTTQMSSSAENWLLLFFLQGVYNSQNKRSTTHVSAF